MLLLKKIKIKKEILFILILGNLLSALSLKIELFRLYTSIIFGLIALLCFINDIKDKDFKNKIILFLLLPSIFSFCFYPLGNNHLFNKLNYSSTKFKIENSKYDYNIWPENKVQIINTLTDLSKKCDVEYLENLTWDSIYSTVGNYDRIKVMPYAQFKVKYLKKIDLIENIKNSEPFMKLINNEIVNSNIIVLITGNNHIFKDENLNLSSNYNLIKIDESNVKGKPEILRIYYPKKCIV